MVDDSHKLFSDIFKREKQKFDHFSLKSTPGTQGVAENLTVRHRCQFLPLELYYNTEPVGAVIDRNKDTRLSQYGFSISQYIAICFLA